MSKIQDFLKRTLAGLLAIACLTLPLAASNEITVTASLQYANPAQNIPAVALQLLGSQFTIAGKNYTYGTQSVPTTAGGTAIPISNLASLGWGIFKNADSTNYIQILTAVSGTAFVRLQPGEVALIKIDPGITAPAALAHTATAQLQYLILEL